MATDPGSLPLTQPFPVRMRQTLITGVVPLKVHLFPPSISIMRLKTNILVHAYIVSSITVKHERIITIINVLPRCTDGSRLTVYTNLVGQEADKITC